jgi:CubicO group peptidase (beta-lactamase class C family)
MNALIQKNVQTLLDRLCAEGRERGIQVAAYRDGELLANAWAGIADVNTCAPVEAGTLFPVFSVTKGFVATLIHQLVERNLLGYPTRIAEIWPEFGANGKGAITVSQVLRHSAGLTRLPAEMNPTDAGDWDVMCRMIEGLAPEWEPGSRCAYHGLTYGWILGEVARRVDGRGFSQLLREEIAEPLGLRTLFVGLPTEVVMPVAWLEEPEFVMPPNDGLPQVVPRSLLPLSAWMNLPEGRRACVPAGSGIMNAQAVARHYAALLPGGVDGVELLPPDRVAIATETRPFPLNEEGKPTAWGYGYSVGMSEAAPADSPALFGHGGHGGSMGLVDRDHRLAVGLTRNRLQKETPLPELLALLRSR